MKTPDNPNLLQGKIKSTFEISFLRGCSCFSLFFEGIDILDGVMENLLKPWCQEGYKYVLYGVSKRELVDLLKLSSWCLLVLCYLCLPLSALV